MSTCKNTDFTWDGECESTKWRAAVAASTEFLNTHSADIMRVDVLTALSPFCPLAAWLRTIPSHGLFEYPSAAFIRENSQNFQKDVLSKSRSKTRSIFIVFSIIWLSFKLFMYIGPIRIFDPQKVQILGFIPPRKVYILYFVPPPDFSHATSMYIYYKFAFLYAY